MFCNIPHSKIFPLILPVGYIWRVAIDQCHLQLGRAVICSNNRCEVSSQWDRHLA